MMVREKPPLRLHWHIKTPNGLRYRWGTDEHKPENAPSGVTFSTTLPGGFEQHAVTLARKPDVDYADLAEFSTITVAGVDGKIAWQGRLETVPRASGDQLAITPGAVGWQAALADNQNITMIYVDRDLTQWTDPSTSRQVALANSNSQWASSSAATDVSGVPALMQTLQDSWVSPNQPINESWYDAGPGNLIATIGYAITAAAFGSGWNAFVLTSTDTNVSTFSGTGNLIASAGSASGFVTPTSARRYAVLQHYDTTTPGGAQGDQFPAAWSNIAVYGNHGLTIRGTQPNDGLYASDIITHALQTWVPQLATTKAGVSTIEQSSIVIPQMAFKDPTTVADIITQAIRFGLPDWWVDEGPTFNLASRANHGNKYVARVGPSGLSETGPQVDRMWNSVVVQYSDVSGVTKTVGPTGSGADTTDSSLTDSDPLNPCTVAGLTRRALIKMGISTASNAILLGATFLQEQKLISTAGQAVITGHVQNAQNGAWVAAWSLRAGDCISFVDAHDTSYRRIVKTDYNDASKQNTLTLDSPPDGLDALLQRLSAVIQPLGLS